MKKEMGSGFRGGEYVTGALRADVRRTNVVRDIATRSKAVLVGSKYKYALWWETGHWAYPSYYNEKRGKFYAVKNSIRNVREYRRVQKWVPTLLRMQDELRNVYARTVSRMMR